MTKYFLILIFNLSLNSNILNLPEFGLEQYQPIIVNGQVLPNMPSSNHQQPEERYKVIESMLKNYKRPFTMLDIGAAQGYHSLMAAWQFPDSVFVMLEGNNNAYPKQGDSLLSICINNTQLNNIIHLNKSIYIEDLLNLSKCEHFDVVLVLNILHWLGGQWKSAIDVLMYLGDNIIIETPPAEESEEKRQIIAYLQSLGAKKIAEVPRHVGIDKVSPMFLLKSDKSKSLEKSTWLKNDTQDKERDYRIVSNFTEKFLKKIDTEAKPYKEVIAPWHPGINLITFKMYNGAYPLTDTLKQELFNWKDELHTDWQPNNFIVQGNKLKMIDYISEFCANVKTEAYTYNRYNKMLKFLESTDPKTIEMLFSEIVGSSRG